MILAASVVVAVIAAAILAAILDNPAAVGLIVGLPATVLGVIALRRTMKVDRAAAASAAVSAGSQAARDVVEGLNTLIDNLQEDNKQLRENQRVLQEKVIQVETDCTDIKRELGRVQTLLTDRGVADDLLEAQKGEADVLRGEQKDEAQRVEDEGL